MKYTLPLAILVACAGCGNHSEKDEIAASDSAAAHKPPVQVTTGDGRTIVLPPPFHTQSNKHYCKVIGWADGEHPTAPEGFRVSKFASGMKNPRWIYELPNGDVLVSCANTEDKGMQKVKNVADNKIKAEHLTTSANIIMCFRGSKIDGSAVVSDTFLSGLHQPLGMLLLGNSLYVALTDGVIRYPYTMGEMRMRASGQKILAVPPAGYNNHWTRNIIASSDGSKIYVSVGSGSNYGEHGIESEDKRANILEFNPDGTNGRVYAGGLRNPLGMGWAPGTNTLWTVVNERDELGDDLVPDYFTSVQDGAFYGWPYSYYGQNEEPRLPVKLRRPDLVKKAIVPDVSLGSHTATLGLAFYEKDMFPAKYKNGAFLGQHGSWNSTVLHGYKVVFIPFSNGRPAGPQEDFLTGFLADTAASTVHGRPVGVTILHDGSMLVADDISNTVWKVTYAK